MPPVGEGDGVGTSGIPPGVSVPGVGMPAGGVDDGTGGWAEGIGLVGVGAPAFGCSLFGSIKIPFFYIGQYTISR